SRDVLEEFLLPGICCSIFLLKCIWFLKYFLPYLWNFLPSSYFRSMGEWAGKGTFNLYSLVEGLDGERLDGKT
uniref:Hydroxysteroid 17-beta dehydrogenase 3 n=1 Tax=Naja naja TaxID=35670 RepID=A0A8C6YBP9_NAJNA